MLTDRRIQDGTTVALVSPDPLEELHIDSFWTPLRLNGPSMIRQCPAENSCDTRPSRGGEDDDRVRPLESNIECACVVAVDNPFVGLQSFLQRDSPFVARGFHPTRTPIEMVEMHDGKARPSRKFVGKPGLTGSSRSNHGYALHVRNVLTRTWIMLNCGTSGRERIRGGGRRCRHGERRKSEVPA